MVTTLKVVIPVTFFPLICGITSWAMGRVGLVWRCMSGAVRGVPGQQCPLQLWGHFVGVVCRFFWLHGGRRGGASQQAGQCPAPQDPLHWRNWRHCHRANSGGKIPLGSLVLIALSWKKNVSICDSHVLLHYTLLCSLTLSYSIPVCTHVYLYINYTVTTVHTHTHECTHPHRHTHTHQIYYVCITASSGDGLVKIEWVERKQQISMQKRRGGFSVLHNTSDTNILILSYNIYIERERERSSMFWSNGFQPHGRCSLCIVDVNSWWK